MNEISISNDWLLIDVSNLAYRSLYTMGGLSYDDLATGVVYGIFRDILYLTDRFGTNNIAFCFDCGSWRRKRLYSGYKSGRLRKLGEMTDEEAHARTDLRRQLNNLRNTWLPEMGFRNVFFDDGYEADDVIASICRNHEELGGKIIVSSDQDLFQLLDESTIVFNPVSKVITNRKSFEEKFKTRPDSWSMVKAIAGCSSDDIPGVKGVGEITAIKFLRNELKEESKAFQAIVNEHSSIRLFQKLTELPFPGCKKFELRGDSVTAVKWNKVMRSMGMESLVRK